MTSNDPTESKPKKWDLQQLLGMLILVLMFGCIVAIAIIRWQLRDVDPFTARDYYQHLPNHGELSPLEGNAEIKLPTSAHEIYSYTTGLRAITIKVRFSMDPGDMENFIGSTLCKDALQEMEPRAQSSMDGTSDWWTPNQAEYIEGCSGESEHSFQTVMIDMTDSNVYIVYVLTSTG